MTEPIHDIRFTAAVDIQAADSGKPTVSITAYLGGLLEVETGRFVVDLAGLQIPEAIPLLSDHQNERSGIVGQVKPASDGRKLTASGFLSTAGIAGKEIVGLHRDGIRFQASIGAKVIESQIVRAGETVTVNGQKFKEKQPFRVVRASSLKEISLVAVGADAGGTSVDIAAKNKGAGHMADEITITLAEDDIRKNERERITKIEATCKSSAGGWGENQAEVDGLKVKAIGEEITFETLQAGLLDIMRSSRPKAPAGHPHTQSAKSTDVLECKLLMRAGLVDVAKKDFDEATLEAADRLHIESLWDVAKETMRLSGVDTAGMRRDDVIQASLGGFSGGEVPQLLGNTINRSLLAAYEESPATWKSFAAIRSAKDFKDHTSIRPTAFDTLDAMPSGGSMHHADVGEATFTWSVDRFAKILRVDEITLINDDLNFLQETAPGFGRAAMRSVADNVFTTVMANAASFFSSGNSNLETGGGSDLDRTTLITVLQSFRSRRNADDVDLDVKPKVLVLPPELEITGRELLQSIELSRTATSDGVPIGNALLNTLGLEVETRLSNTARFSDASTTAWFVFAGPQDAGLILAFLQGRTVPRLRFFGIDQTVEQLAVSWTVDHNYGSTLGDPVAGHKADGA